MSKVLKKEGGNLSAVLTDSFWLEVKWNQDQSAVSRQQSADSRQQGLSVHLSVFVSLKLTTLKLETPQSHGDFYRSKTKRITLETSQMGRCTAAHSDNERLLRSRCVAAGRTSGQLIKPGAAPAPGLMNIHGLLLFYIMNALFPAGEEIYDGSVSSKSFKAK